MDEKLKEAYDELIMYKIHSIFAFSVFDDYADKYAAMLGYRRKTQNRAWTDR